MASTSLRARVVAGSLFWMAGLLLVASVVATSISRSYPGLNAALHHSMMLFTGLVCCLAGFMLVRHGLSPISKLRARLSAVRLGQERRVAGSYPAEVQMLVTDLNSLLDEREQRVGRALTAADDLAHGLKTPLAVLAQEADRAAAAGHHELAETLRHEVDRMRRQVDLHLARARAAGSGADPAARCLVAESTGALVRVLRRLHADRCLAIDTTMPADHAVRCHREALDEMLGNLLDNACTFASSRVAIASTERDGAIAIEVDDDGPGLDPDLWDQVLQRGVRADETAPGSGLGLAIVRDLAEMHGGTIVLGRSSLGGLRAGLTLPAAGHGER
jgi:signal transduction histidine kinase